MFIAEPSTFHAIYRAAWVNNKNIGDDEELVKVLDAEGFDGRGLLDATRDPAIKGQLIANVEVRSVGRRREQGEGRPRGG